MKLLTVSWGERRRGENGSRNRLRGTRHAPRVPAPNYPYNKGIPTTTQLWRVLEATQHVATVCSTLQWAVQSERRATNTYTRRGSPRRKRSCSKKKHCNKLHSSRLETTTQHLDAKDNFGKETKPNNTSKDAFTIAKDIGVECNTTAANTESCRTQTR
jgi:hypothetical protein